MVAHAKRRPPGTAHSMGPGLDIQEEPESTIGRRPADVHGPESPPPETRGEPADEQFARSRTHREDAEESEVGAEIRAREDEQMRADEERSALPASSGSEPTRQ